MDVTTWRGLSRQIRFQQLGIFPAAIGLAITIKFSVTKNKVLLC